MSPPKKPNPPTPVESKNPMSPRKSSELEEPPELPLPRELELELDELLREPELLDREPLLKDWPPPGRASKKVIRGETNAAWAIAASDAGAALAKATAMAAVQNRQERCRRGFVMRAARRGAR
jgi:hypothetical protein